MTARYASVLDRASARRHYRAAPAPAPGFNPKDIGGCAACWVADDLALGDGAAVAAWVDRKAGFSAAQGTGGKQPLYRAAVAALNGAPAVDFDGVDDILRYGAANAVSQANAGHVFVVANFDNITVCAPWLSSDEATLQWYIGGLINTTKMEFQSYDNTNPIDTLRGDQVLVAGTSYLLEYTSTGAAYVLRLNGTAQALTPITGSSSGIWFDDVLNRDNFTIGGMIRSDTGLFVDGKVAAVIVVDGAISAGDRASLGAWVTAKYGFAVA